MSSTRLEALLQISDTIAGVRDLKDLLHLLANPLRHAVDFEYVAVILKETGFPHAGKPAYTLQTQAAFWTAYLKPGRLAPATSGGDNWVFYGVGFEAFDLPWKSEESKLEIEKSWGLLSPSREAYPAFDVWRNATAAAQPAAKKP